MGAHSENPQPEPAAPSSGRDPFRLLDLLFEQPGVALCLVGPAGEVLRASRDWLRSTGYRWEDVRGADILELFPEVREFSRALHDRVRAGESLRVPRHVQRLHGRETWWEGQLSPVPMAGGTGVLIVSREVTADVAARSAAERALAEQAARLLRSYELTAALAAAHTPDEVVAIVFERGLSALGADAAVLAVPGDGGALKVERTTGYPREQAERWGHLAASPGSPLAEAARTRSAVWIASRGEAAAWPGTWAESIATVRDRAFAALPLVVEGELLAVLGLGFVDETCFHPEDRARHLSVSQKCAQAFDRTRLFVREREARALAERTAEALRAANEGLETAAREKDGFLAMLAHELRNPLAAISNSARVIRLRAARGEDLERPLAMLERQVRNGARLLDDLLDVSRLTRGLVDLRREPVRLDVIVASAVESQRALLDAAGHRLALELPDAPLAVSGDPTRLEQVVANLVHNAAKYTPERGHVRVALAHDGEDALLTVEDDGAGIAPELLPRIFELFVQGETGLARSRGGLGLGLTLVRRLVELHGGTVAARSAGPGRGAAFTVRLRAVPLPAPPAGAPARGGLRAGGPGARVLVVEDNLDAAALLAEYLRILGHDVRVANDGVGAIATLSAFTPDVALLDVGLPGMDGYELAGRLRARLGDDALLVAVTGYGQDSDRRRALQAGFARHLTKPVAPEELAEVVAGATRPQRDPPAA